ncbi:bifunctional DNA primase/polymerase [Mesorhizobium sp. M0139]|uniref:bifunctional DNA primase/polymerase n=1 Tax=Mesorhizobium sp. M0139 TaxID=2956892 RepID=UPI003336E19C
MQPTKLAAALEAAANGFRVFPVIPNSKVPAIDDWPDLATSAAKAITAWWAENPNYNIGIATGRGVTVIDADCKKGKSGLDSLAMLDMMGLPESLRATTPSGGVHVYLRTAKAFGNRADTIPDFPGIDLRGERGYVLAPGSTIDGEAYKTEVYAKPDKAPQWLEDTLDRRTTHAPRDGSALIELDRAENIARAVDWLVNHAPEAVEGAGGDTVTYSVAAELRAFGVAEATALDLMLDHWNEVKASPPWMPDELAVKVRNGFEHGQGAPGYKTAGGEFGAVDIDVGVAPIRPADQRGETIPVSALNIRSAASFADQEKPVRQFVVADLIPDKNVTTLNGDGATGKSLLAMQLCVAMSSGSRWIGRDVKPGPALYFSAEDDEDETHIRLKDICAGENLALDTLGGLHVAVMAGKDCLLAVAGENDAAVLKKTKLFSTLRATLAELRPALLVLDNLADIFGGNENVKSLARQFIGMLRGLAIEFDCAILLLAHPSLSGMASGSGSSGNVAWNNSVRSRLYLQRDKDDAGVEIDPNVRILETKKANYAGIGQELEMRWEAGRFVATAAFEFGDVEGMEDPETKVERAERVFLEMVDRFNKEKRHISPSKGANYAPMLFARHHRHAGVPERFFEIALNSLLEKGSIEVVTVGPPSRLQKNIVFARGELHASSDPLQTPSEGQAHDSAKP